MRNHGAKIWAATEVWTQDLPNTSQTLLPLSHIGLWDRENCEISYVSSIVYTEAIIVTKFLGSNLRTSSNHSSVGHHGAWIHFFPPPHTPTPTHSHTHTHPPTHTHTHITDAELDQDDLSVLRPHSTQVTIEWWVQYSVMWCNHTLQCVCVSLCKFSWRVLREEDEKAEGKSNPMHTVDLQWCAWL